MDTRATFLVGSMATSRAIALVLVVLSAAFSAGAQTLFTNVEIANVTPGGFSVVAAVTRATLTGTNVGVYIFSDSAGVTNLNGQVGVELYPLNSGDPKATNRYQTFLSESTLRAGSMGLGLIYARVTLCNPATTYYYQIAVTNASGQASYYPSNGPLPSATTALENSFVLQSQQLLVTVNDSFPPGSIITLANSNTPSLLAAVVGDGAGNNQVFFSLNDMIAASGGTNFAPVGTQVFSASVLGYSTNGPTQGFSVPFGTNFSIGQYSSGVLGLLATTIAIGNGAMQTGGSNGIPVTINAQSAVVGLSFVLRFPTNLFTSISVQPSISAVGAASVNLLSSNSVLLKLSASTGNNLQGNQQVAQLNLTAASNQPSAFVPIVPQSPAATNTDSSIVADFSLQSGRAVIVGAQPLLEMQHSGPSVNLVLYGIPGNTYEIQSATSIPLSWSNFALVPMSSLSQVFGNLNPFAPAVFFRAYSFNADPPIIQAVPSGTQRSLLAYGIPGTNYMLLSAGSLPAVWSPVRTYTLTNSFLYLTNLGNSAPIFYRLQR